jgi:hypothetical protein
MRHEDIASKKISKFMRSRGKGRFKIDSRRRGQDEQARAAQAASEAAAAGIVKLPSATSIVAADHHMAQILLYR